MPKALIVQSVMSLVSVAVLVIGVMVDHAMMVISGIVSFLLLLVAIRLSNQQYTLDAAIRHMVDANDIVRRHRLISGGLLVQTSDALIFADALVNIVVRSLSSARSIALVSLVIRATGVDDRLPIVFVYCPNDPPLAVPWKTVRACDQMAFPHKIVDQSVPE